MDVSASGKQSTTICGISAIGHQDQEAGTGFRKTADEVVEAIQSKLCSPRQTMGLCGDRYFTTCIDETSGRGSLSLLRTKEKGLSAFQVYRARAEKSSGKHIKFLKDHGGVESHRKIFITYLKEAGIAHVVSPQCSPVQNGWAVRGNRTIMENAHSILEEAQPGTEFLGQAVLTAAHIHNDLFSRSHKDMVPLEYRTGKPPGVAHLRVFCSTTWVHIPKEKRPKLDPKSVKYIPEGYEGSSGSREYRPYEPKENRMLTSRNVVVDGSTPVFEHHKRSDTTIGWGKNSKIHAPEKETTTVSESDFSVFDTIHHL